MFAIKYSINKDFYKVNKRYIYNVRDYIKIENVKTYFTQCFLHLYRDNKYKFIIINIVQICFEKNDLSKSFANLILNFFVHIYIAKQRIFDI